MLFYCNNVIFTPEGQVRKPDENQVGDFFPLWRYKKFNSSNETQAAAVTALWTVIVCHSASLLDLFDYKLPLFHIVLFCEVVLCE